MRVGAHKRAPYHSAKLVLVLAIGNMYEVDSIMCV